MRRAVLAILVVLLVPVPAFAAPDIAVQRGTERFRGRAEEASFPRRMTVRVGEKEHLLDATGSGVRRRMMFRVYECAGYAEGSLAGIAEPGAALLEGTFARALSFRFLRDVTGDKAREAFAEGIARSLPKPTGAVTTAMEEFLTVFDGGMKTGDSLELLWIPGVGLWVEVRGAARPLIANDDLARAMWKVYFGPDPINEDLKQDLLRFVGAE